MDRNPESTPEVYLLAAAKACAFIMDTQISWIPKIHSAAAPCRCDKLEPHSGTMYLAWLTSLA